MSRRDYNLLYDFISQVTIEWWAQIWLYEGFTSWIKYLCANSADDTLDALTQFVSCEYIKAINLDGLASSHPIEVRFKLLSYLYIIIL